MEIGLRVVRGPDWHWQMQDSGEGHTGTVVEVGKPGDGSTPDKTVVVQWDSGLRTNYRAGYHGAYDLRIFDNAPIGVRHPNISCNNCKVEGIQGFRWKCAKCNDFNLCNVCYMNDRHDINHSFIRFDTPTSVGIKVSRRLDATKIEAAGLFGNARVLRGPDWDWGNQDGGDGKVGRIVDIRGWDTESGRSVASVVWSSGNTNVYRIGHKGKVDLKCIETSSGGYYYRDHLPLLSGEVSDGPSMACPPRPKFKVGDRVKVVVEIDVLRTMQEGHGGWNFRMTRHIGKIGRVHRLTDRGDIRVQYDTQDGICKWTLNPDALNKVDELGVGDFVQISSDVHEVKQLQKGHGEWNEAVKRTLGRMGQVIKVHPNGDVRVLIDGKQYNFNGACCLPAPHGGLELNNTTATPTERDNDNNHRRNGLAALLRQLMDARLTSSREPEFLVHEAAQGHFDVVHDIIQHHPGKVDMKSSGKTALQVASHQGHKEIVKLLIDAGANLDICDEDGDQALHFAAFGNQPEVCKLLLEKGAKPNAINADHCTAMHVAVNKQHVGCVQVLVSVCDINSQDKYGDTALHDAISKENVEIMELLINSSQIDLNIRNRRGFNPLHHAALKGNSRAMELMLQRARQLVDGKKDDGFASLHLAALNGYSDVANVLVSQGQADINIINNRHQTPLMLAVSQGHIRVIELLISKGCHINNIDEDGNSALHLSLLKHSAPCFSGDSSSEIASIEAELPPIERDVQKSLSVAVYLVKHGSSLTLSNHQNKTALLLAANSAVVERLKSVQCLVPKSEPELVSPNNECLVCSDVPACITFDPCGHCIVCEDCSIKVKKCIVCRAPVGAKLIGECSARSLKLSSITNDKINSNGDSSQSSIAELEMLRKQMQQMEDAWICSICIERTRCVAFMCGHSTCAECAQSLRQCPMCRTPIRRKINLF